MNQTFRIVVNRCYGGFSLSSSAIKRLGELGGLADIDRIKNETLENYQYRQYYNIKRTDLKLIQVVEELGDKANGECAQLEIQTIDIDIDIESFDGKEEVEVSGRILLNY